VATPAAGRIAHDRPQQAEEFRGMAAGRGRFVTERYIVATRTSIGCDPRRGETTGGEPVPPAGNDLAPLKPAGP